MTADMIRQKTSQLLSVLDKDIEHIEQTLYRLDELRSLVIKRDAKSLEVLLENIQVDADGYAQTEAQRHQLRCEIAELLGRDVNRFRLGELAEILGEPSATPLMKKRQTLRQLAEKLITEHKATAMLLAECARFNGELLSRLIRAVSNNSVTYGRTGKTSKQNEAAFMNMEF